MTIEHLWAGWRANYVASVGAENKDEATSQAELDGLPVKDEAGREDNNCVFCRILESDASDEERYIVHRGTTCVVILNAYPYATGHMLVMPIRHIDDIERLDDPESAELWAQTRASVRAARLAYGAEGMNIGVNLGRAAGAGIPRHLHFHVVPRWIGDTNFMTTVASVRVMPEALSVSWRKLTQAWPKRI